MMLSMHQLIILKKPKSQNKASPCNQVRERERDIPGMRAVEEREMADQDAVVVKMMAGFGRRRKIG